MYPLMVYSILLSGLKQQGFRYIRMAVASITNKSSKAAISIVVYHVSVFFTNFLLPESGSKKSIFK